MKFLNETFKYFDAVDSEAVYSDNEFVKCHFLGCKFSNTDAVSLRSAVKNMSFTDCKITGGRLGAGIVENVIVDGLKVGNHFQTFGTVFKHVVIKGKVNKLMLTPYVDIFDLNSSLQKQFDEANTDYYNTVDWALDISQAEFNECDIRGVPSRLIKRDVETQVVIQRENVLNNRWQEIDLSDTYWGTSIEFFLDSGFNDIVLVAPKKSPNFSNLLKGLNLLRDTGIANPD